MSPVYEVYIKAAGMPLFPSLSSLHQIPALCFPGFHARSSAFEITAAASKLKLFSLDERRKPLDQILFRQFLALPMLFHAIDFLRRNDDIADDLDDSIPGNAIFNDDLCESVDFDVDISTVASDVHAQIFVGKESREIKLQDDSEQRISNIGCYNTHVEDPLWNVLLSYLIGFVIGVGVKGVIGDDVVQQKSFKVFLSITAEQKRIGLRTQQLECKVRRREEGASDVCRRIV